MKNFYNIEILRLRRNYIDSKQYSKKLVLDKLAVIALENNGFIPYSFEIPIKCLDSDDITAVLNDIGYPHIRSIKYKCFDDSVLVDII